MESHIRIFNLTLVYFSMLMFFFFVFCFVLLVLYDYLHSKFTYCIVPLSKIPL